ncbi:uncharacterized protein [Nothobranchius furzeri]|uniref:uncharacterized protein n=1 Tax=Nothobranchius furzeri TaxID=105023 RepID=UPI002403CF2C|nr:uncharacterized protein LOC107379868 [Nothobranchius furzeri]
MDGESHKERIDDGWGPNEILNTLGEQLACLETVIDTTNAPAAATEQKKLLRKTAEKLMKEKGKDVNSAGNWGIIWGQKVTETGKKEEEARKLMENAGMFGKKKHQKEVEKLIARKAKYNQWALLWKLAKPKMKKRKIEQNATDQQPPPYSGIYPVLSITGGTMSIEEEQPTAPLLPVSPAGPAAAQQDRKDFFMSNQRASSSLSQVTQINNDNSSTPKSTCPSGMNGDALPFAGRIFRQQVEELENTMREARESPIPRPLKTTQWTGSFVPINPPLPDSLAAASPLSPSNPFTVKGELRAVAQTEQTTPQNLVVTMNLMGHDEPEEQTCSTADTRLDKEWSRQDDEDSINEIEAELVDPSLKPDTPHRRDRVTPIPDRHSYHTRSKGAVFNPHGQYPLVQAKTSGPKVYQPYTFGDIQALVDKLPDIAEGGNAWLADLDKYTSGQDLALGDFRAIITRCTSRSQAADLEQNAGTALHGNEVPLVQVLRTLGPALRKQFPPKNQGTLHKFKWDGKINPTNYLNKAIDDWVNHTGHHPSRESSQSLWFRKAVLRGVPEIVNNKMEDNPELADCDFNKWKNHLIFNLNKIQVTEEKESDNLEELQKQLLRVQLQAAKKTLGEKGDKTKKQMVATAAPPPAVPNPNQFPYPWQQPPQLPGYNPPPTPFMAQKPPYEGHRGGFGGRGQG